MPFKPGKDWVGNRKGRPTNFDIEKLKNAILEGEKKHGKDIFRHAVDRAFVNDTVLIALIKKFIPDRIYNEGEIAKVVNILYGHRPSTDSPIREGLKRESTPAQSNPTEGT